MVWGIWYVKPLSPVAVLRREEEFQRNLFAWRKLRWKTKKKVGPKPTVRRYKPITYWAVNLKEVGTLAQPIIRQVFRFEET